MDYSLTVKVFFLQPRYFSYSQGIFLKAKVFFLYPRYFSFHCTFTSLGRFVSLTAAGPRRSHRSRTEGWPAISHSCDWDMPSSLQMKKLNFRNMPLKWSEFVWFSWGTPTNPHYKPQTLKVRIETNPTGTTASMVCINICAKLNMICSPFWNKSLETIFGQTRLFLVWQCSLSLNKSGQCLKSIFS